MKKGLLYVISGPSGVGKGAVCRELCSRRPDLHHSISATTRSPREGEVDGVHYHFLDLPAFKRLQREGALLEWAEVYGNYYGTPLEGVEKARDQGFHVLLEIDTQGAMQVKKNYKEGVFIFLLPPSLAELGRRIQGRAADSPGAIRKRLAAACLELQEAWSYDYLVENICGRVDDAVRQVEAIIAAETCRLEHNRALLEKLFEEGETIDLSLY